ncbi:MAG: hypothetical protein AAFZ01_14920, partial [Pseudomonadota bacterium]
MTHGHSTFPREHLARTPTPLEFFPNLTQAVGGAEIWIKRDDETGLALGGNNTRVAELYFHPTLQAVYVVAAASISLLAAVRW